MVSKLAEIKKLVRAHLENEGKIAEGIMALTPNERRSLALYMARVAAEVGKKYPAYGAGLEMLKTAPGAVSKLMGMVDA